MAPPLDKRFLSDSDASRLYRLHRELKADPDEFCPTCLKEGFYFWPDKDTRVECDCRQQLQLYKHYLNAGIGALYQRLDWDDYIGDDDTVTVASAYLDNAKQMVSRGIGLILLGGYGVGKTLLATLILKNLLHAGHQVFSTTFAGMIEMFTAGWNSEEEKNFFVERVKKSEVLLLDDIGKEFRSKNNLAESTFDSVLRSRVQEGRPTFITTNMSVEDMRAGYGSAVLSLIMETSVMHEIEGTDYRSKAGSTKMQEILQGLTRPIV